MENPNNTGENQVVQRNPDGTFPKGISGNPAGKPKGARHFTSIVQDALIKLGTTEKGEKIEIQKALGEKVVKMALEGNEQMIKLIWNYLDGMPSQRIDLNKDDDLIWDELREMKSSLLGNTPNSSAESSSLTTTDDHSK